jgi:O-antigen/teichoic acid export membrane protein
MLLVSAGLAIVVFSAADLVSEFYDEPGLKHVLFFAGFTFFLTPFSVPGMSLLRREMAFDAIAVIGLSASLANSITTICLAALGFSYMSFAWAMLASALVSAVIVNLYRPGFNFFRICFKNGRKVFSFGGYSSCTAIINTVYQSTPQLIIGQMLNLGAVGLYGRSKMICELPDRLIFSAVHPVLLPALAERVRNGQDLKGPYLRSLEYATVLHWPALLFIALMAEPVVALLLGAQWSDAVPLVRMLALSSLCLFPIFMTYPILVSLGRVRDTLIVSLITVPPSLLVIFIASSFGLQAVAASQFLTAPLQVGVALIYIRRQVKFNVSEFFSAIWKSMSVALWTALAPAVTIALSDFRLDDISVPSLLMTGAAAGCMWLVGLIVSRHPLMQEIEHGRRLVWRHAVARLRANRAVSS